MKMIFGCRRIALLFSPTDNAFTFRKTSLALLWILCSRLTTAQISNPIADQAIAGFNHAFIYESDGLTFYKTALTNNEKDYFWQQALDIQTTEDAYDRTYDDQYKLLVSKLLDAFLAQNSDAGTTGGWTWNEYNDDLIWAVQAFIRGYETTGNQVYLDQAIYGFDLTYYHSETGNWGWDNELGGGIWWRKDKVNKHALSNSPTVVAACRLYKATGNTWYLDKGSLMGSLYQPYIARWHGGPIASSIQQWELWGGRELALPANR